MEVNKPPDSDVTSEEIQNIQISTNQDDEDPAKETVTGQAEGVSTASAFYSNAKKYWSEVSPTVNGMLAGFGSLSCRDVKGSSNFLKNIFELKPPVGRRRAVDCGAGIGRVTKNLLIPLFETVDIVEQDENFANSARQFLGSNASKLGTIYNVGLQDFHPEPGKYDVIWCQWVLSHLTDDDLRMFFGRAIEGLAKNGVIVIKENVTSSGTKEVDTVDSSVTRPLKTFQDIIKSANLRTIKLVKQTDLPKGLYPVYMIAMRPMKTNKLTS